ncbi:hypothetical protein [Paenibacillus sp. PL91]|uniref:hypothetical protein n=1 Tax=Paenibacillus sp. PL91 TaxID=2729538 RepID=UPI00145CD3A2|nr:hypothetical protein [Paenibacillus sp. PL91]
MLPRLAASPLYLYLEPADQSMPFLRHHAERFSGRRYFFHRGQLFFGGRCYVLRRASEEASNSTMYVELEASYHPHFNAG